LPLEPPLPLPLSSEEADDKLPFELSLPPDGVEVVVVLVVVVGVAVVASLELEKSLEMGVVVATGVVDGEAG
jgi:hypothetical protein